jgi:Four helix bundle sensory module for signal transduction
MTIRKKISIASVVWVAVMLVLGVVALLKINQIDSAVHSIAAESLPAIGSSVRLERLVNQQKAMKAESGIAESQGKFRTELKN